MEIRNVLIVDSFVVFSHDKLGHALYHYEIHLAPDADGDAPRTVLVTRDERNYKTALDAEGTPARFTATWHRAARNGKPYQVLDRLQVMS